MDALLSGTTKLTKTDIKTTEDIEKIIVNELNFIIYETILVKNHIRI